MFYIVGVGRSGTSLLQSILSSHSKIAIPPETGFMRENILKFARQKSISHVNLTESNSKVRRLLSSINFELPKEFKNEFDFYDLVLNIYKKEQNKCIIGDKDPRLVEFIHAVSILYPSTKFIHLIRDPRDILQSKKNADWSKNRPIWYHIFANYIQLKLGEYQGKKLKDAYYLVIYEELLNDSEQIISSLCKFLGIKFESRMLNFQDKAKELISEEEMQWKKETMGPLLKNNTGKWKGKLSDWEVALTERLCVQSFKLGGYGVSNIYKKLTVTLKLKVVLTQGGLIALGYMYFLFRILSQKILIAWKY